MVELSDEHRRHAVERRAALLLNGSQAALGVERLSWQHQSAAMAQCGEASEDAAEAMVEGHRQADSVVGGVAYALADEEAVVQDVVMRERGPFRRARRARRVLNVGRIVELQPGLALPKARQLDRVAKRAEIEPTARVLLDVLT